ncbi:alpha/beta-hydrolase [Mycena maculata]|uniref:carboxypeptidase C n=1 Tax=Mycena maculata TaxID=230809 RepID=A0AAD7IVQ9_9AGAR|nr:alpha/beta-hydrolase [Mycena maculata]
MTPFEKHKSHPEAYTDASTEDLPLESPFPRRNQYRRLGWAAFILILNFFLVANFSETAPDSSVPSFYSRISTVESVCLGLNNRTVSHAGHIGLAGDSDESPKRSFFWYFESENNAGDSPVILTIGGGPGTSGMMNPLFGQAPCIATADGLAPNPHRWTEHHNLIALDHPIGVGFSFGSRVNNSRAAAYDVYDFIQKLLILFPHLSKNKFIISGGSYGGVYVPNIATVIHEQNLRVRNGEGRPGSILINLEALILSNPFSDPTAHFTWLLQYRCIDHHVYNLTSCRSLYSELPTCLESIDLAFELPTIENRVKSWELCDHLNSADTNGTVYEDIRRTCFPDDNAPEACHPQFRWVESIFRDVLVKRALGVPPDLNYTALNMEVNAEFIAAGDTIQQHHLLYPPLLAAGIRLLHYVGAQDANCAWPGVLSFLKLLRTPFQADFLSAPDLPWPSKGIATVRSVGKGAGNMTYILLAEAGHFTVKDQPALAKIIVEKWVANQAFLT